MSYKKITTWNYVEYNFLDYSSETSEEEILKYNIQLPAINISCSLDDAINDFCRYLNKTLNHKYYAKKIGNHIILYERSPDIKTSDEIVNVFFNFNFFDTNRITNNGYCRAFV